MKFTEYTLPAFWASALINGDYTGLSDEDEKALTAWLEAEKPGWCVTCSDEEFFTRYHDASYFVLACNCLTFTFERG